MLLRDSTDNIVSGATAMAGDQEQGDIGKRMKLWQASEEQRAGSAQLLKWAVGLSAAFLMGGAFAQSGPSTVSVPFLSSKPQFDPKSGLPLPKGWPMPEQFPDAQDLSMARIGYTLNAQRTSDKENYAKAVAILQWGDRVQAEQTRIRNEYRPKALALAQQRALAQGRSYATPADIEQALSELEAQGKSGSAETKEPVHAALLANAQQLAQKRATRQHLDTVTPEMITQAEADILAQDRVSAPAAFAHIQAVDPDDAKLAQRGRTQAQIMATDPMVQKSKAIFLAALDKNTAEFATAIAREAHLPQETPEMQAHVRSYLVGSIILGLRSDNAAYPALFAEIDLPDANLAPAIPSSPAQDAKISHEYTQKMINQAHALLADSGVKQYQDEGAGNVWNVHP